MELVRPDGARLWWTSEGEGPAVVVSHGLFGDHRLYGGLAAALRGAGFRVVRWDLRLHGRSSRGTHALVFDDLVGDLLSVCEAADVTRAVLVGHDLGGVLTLEAALARPELVLGASVWCTDPTPAPRDRLAHAAVSAARQVAMRPLVIAIEPFMTRRGGQVALLQRRMATTLAPAGIAEVIDATTRRRDLVPRLVGVRWPAQVVWGELDVLVRPFAPFDLTAVLPTAEPVPVPEAGHLVHVDQPEVVIPAVVAFARRAAA